MKIKDVTSIILYKKYVDNKETEYELPEDHREDVYSVPFRFRPEIIEIVYNEYNEMINKANDTKIKVDALFLYNIDKLVVKLTETINEKLRGVALH